MPFAHYGRSIRDEALANDNNPHLTSTSSYTNMNHTKNQDTNNQDTNTMGRGNCYYEYDHATGKYNLRNGDKTLMMNNVDAPPKYSWKCILCNAIDVLIFAGCIAFLFFSIRYAFYCLENYGDGGN